MEVVVEPPLEGQGRSNCFKDNVFFFFFFGICMHDRRMMMMMMLISIL